MVRYFVLLFNSWLRLFVGKLNSKWTGTFFITKVFPHGAVELENNEGSKFTINREITKTYLEKTESVYEMVETYNLNKVRVIKRPTSFRNIKSSTSWEATQGVHSSK